MQGTMCNGADDHSFKSYLIESLPPTPEQMEAVAVANWEDARDAELVIKALSTQRYAVACERCGMTIGVDSNAKVSE